MRPNLTNNGELWSVNEGSSQLDFFNRLFYSSSTLEVALWVLLKLYFVRARRLLKVALRDATIWRIDLNRHEWNI
jgi:hypothetical protein